MANNVTEYGRQKVSWPDLGSSPGVTLHGQITSSIANLSNSITGKWAGVISFAIGQTIQVDHNFNTSISNLKIIVTESGVIINDTDIASILSYTELDTNSIQISNISGVPKTLEIYVYPHKANITDAEIESLSGSKIVDPNFGTQDVVANSALVSNIGASGDTSMKTIHGYGRIVSPVQTASPTGTEIIDCSQKHIVLKVGGTADITLDNLSEGQTLVLVVSSTGSPYNITWVTPIKWPEQTIPTPSDIANVKDVYTFVKIGGDIFGAVTLAMG